MAKELPYFQFEPAEYMAGNIQLCTLEAQGVFINVCALYWLRSCELKYNQLTRRYDPEQLTELINEECIAYDEETDKISIEFLDVQFTALMDRKKRLSEAGKKGAAKKKQKGGDKPPLSQAKATPKQPEKKRKEENIKEDSISLNKERISKYLKGSITWLESVARDVKANEITNLTAGEIFNLISTKYLDLFISKLEAEEDLYKEDRDYKSHFSRWLKIQLKNEIKTTNKKTRHDETLTHNQQTARDLGLS